MKSKFKLVDEVFASLDGREDYDIDGTISYRIDHVYEVIALALDAGFKEFKDRLAETGYIVSPDLKDLQGLNYE